MKLNNRTVSMFRCHIDPSIGPTPKNAYKLDDPLLKILGAQAKITEDGHGVVMLIKTSGSGISLEKSKPKLHFVGLPNIQTMELELTDAEIEALKVDFSFDALEKAEALETKKPLGRPKAVISGAV